ncbi:MAG: ABC transporter ATP-binding protein [Rhodovarius sp.]|nr:ABC transporter ATP-binding protein [Rhodovarius sp.]
MSTALAPSTAAQAGATPLVRIRDLHVTFATRERTVHALNGVDLDLAAGEVLCILGESGSGKSVTLRALLRILPRFARISGRIEVAGRDVMAMGARELADFRGAQAAMVFQEPMTALDPVFTIGRQIAEVVERHEGASRAQAEARALELLELVQIPSAKRRLSAYPHELSGGLRQRAMIAVALACRPKLLLADEPTTALDATVQIQVLLLLRELQQKLGMGVIFVTHDLGVAGEIADRVAVMYAGKVVEEGPVGPFMAGPLHPYPRGLLASTVHGHMRGRKLQTIPGAPPALSTPPVACSFAPRCPLAEPACEAAPPPMVEAGAGRRARCIKMLPA